MEKTEVYWLLGIVGTFCGVIAGIVKWYANRLHDSVDKLIDTTNINTTVIAVESKRNDHQDGRLDRHEDEIDTLKEKVFQVTYKKRA
jgi:hypothetical protein